jgi:hypothetical protein
MVNIEQILKQVSEKLINCYWGKTNLRFPKYRDKGAGKIEDRTSEQESKHFFSIVFEQQKSPFSFAVEVPTKEIYAFSGTTKMSARHDMAIYDDSDTSKFMWIIELKYGQSETIEKDFLKMVLSQCNCVWLHTLKNANSRTIPSLLIKLSNAWNKVKAHVKVTEEWEFIIVILKQKIYYHITLKTVDTIEFPNNISKWTCTDVTV